MKLTKKAAINLTTLQDCRQWRDSGVRSPISCLAPVCCAYIQYCRCFLRCFRDAIRVPRISNRVPRIRENYHRVPRIREIGSRHVHTGYLTFSLKKLNIVFKKCGPTLWFFPHLLRNPGDGPATLPLPITYLLSTSLASWNLKKGFRGFVPHIICNNNWFSTPEKENPHRHSLQTFALILL